MDHLSLRYNGPYPLRAAVPSDHDATWAEQLANRRLWAWMTVRRVGRECLHHRREALRLASSAHHNKWITSRHQLRFALDAWSAYRDWSRSTGDTA